MKSIVLYGIGGADKMYRALSYYQIFIDEVDDLVAEIQYRALMMRKNPEVKAVYMMSNRPGLRRDFLESQRKNSIESCAIFRDLLERKGILID